MGQNNFRKIIMLFIVGLTVLMPATALSGEGDEALIKGFAKWQADRINKLVLDDVLNGVIKDPYVKKFFVETSEKLTMYEGSSIQNVIPLIQYYSKRDLDVINKEIPACLASRVDYWKSLDMSGALEIASSTFKFKKSVGKLSESIKKLITNKKVDMKVDDEIIKARYTVTNFIADVCPKVDEYLLEEEVGAIQKLEVYSALSQSDLAKKSLAILKEDKSNDNKLHVKFNEILNKPEYTLAKNAFNFYVNNYKNFSERSGRSNLVSLNFLLEFIDQVGLINEKNILGFNRMKKSAILIANLIDAKDSGDEDAVVAVLTSFVNTHDTLNKKREESAFFSRQSHDSYAGVWTFCKYKGGLFSGWSGCNNSIFLSSYYGVSKVRINDDGKRNGAETRFFGPVGIEFKLATINQVPIMINYSPYDLGGAITSELKSEEYSAEINDIKSPSYFLSFSAPSKPVSFLIGYQEDMTIAEDVKADGWFVSVAFDLPIVTLY